MSDELPGSQETQKPEFEDFREQDIESDFEIHVHQKSFKVHQQTLKKHSGYFRTLLANADSRKEFVKLDSLTEKAVEKCIEYFYTGRIDTTADNARELLEAGELFQLPKVQECCFKALEQALNISNCISVYILAKSKGKQPLAEKSQRVFSKSFNCKAIDDFLQLSEQETENFLQRLLLGNEAIWIGIREWIEHDLEKRKDSLAKLVAFVDWEEFPSESLLTELWQSPLFSNSEMCKIQLFQSVFMDLEKLQRNLSVQNYFIVQKISTQFTFLTKQTKELLTDFLFLNVFELIKSKEFLLLDENQIVLLYKDKCFRYVIPQEWRWIIAIKWTEHEQARCQTLSKILPTFRYDRMEQSFLEEKVKNDLLKNPTEIGKGFHAMITFWATSKNNTNIAVQLSDKRLCVFDVATATWLEPADEHHINNKIKLKGKNILFQVTKGTWKTLPTAKSLHFTGTENNPNDILQVQAMVHGEVDESTVISGTKKHTFAIGGSIIGITSKSVSYSSEIWSLSIFNARKRCWGKDLRSREFGHGDGKFVVVGSSFYIIGRLLYHSSSSVIKLTLRHGKFQEINLQKLPFPVSYNNIKYDDQDVEKWPLNVDNRLVVVTSCNIVFIYNDISKDWSKLSLPIQSGQHSITGAYSFDSLE